MKGEPGQVSACSHVPGAGFSPPSGYYDWLNRRPSARARQDARLKGMIVAEWIGSGVIYVVTSMNRSGRYQLERQFSGWDSHPPGKRAFPQRTETSGLGGLIAKQFPAELNRATSFALDCALTSDSTRRNVDRLELEAMTIQTPQRRTVMKKLFAIIGIVAPAALVLAILAGASSPRGPDAVSTISTLLDYDGSACNTNCELLACDQEGHKNLDIEEGNDTGRTHEDCREESTCFEHACRPTFTLAPQELNTVVELIPRLSIGGLVALHEAEANLSINREREVVQVLGCQGKALASIKLTASQKAALELAD